MGLSFSSLVNEDNTSFLDSVERVNGLTKFFEFGVITILTEDFNLIKSLTRIGILYAAIPPDIPIKTFLSLKTLMFLVYYLSSVSSSVSL